MPHDHKIKLFIIGKEKDKAKPQAKGTQHLGLLTHCINTRKIQLKMGKEQWRKMQRANLYITK
jgi:hypothetical protein